MKKVLGLFLTFTLILVIFGTVGQVDVKSEEAHTTLGPTDFDTTLPEIAQIQHDSGFGITDYGKFYSVNSVAATSDGGYVAGGNVITDDSWWVLSPLMIKYASDNTVEWSTEVFVDTNDWYVFLTAVQQDSNGDYWAFVSDEVHFDNGTPADDSDDWYEYNRVLAHVSGTDQSILGTFASSADQAQWEGSAWDSNSIEELSNGNILLTSTQNGSLLYEIIDPTDYSLVTSGTYASATGSNDYISQIKAAVDPTGGFFLTAGFSAADGSFTGETLLGDVDVVVTAFDNAGTLQWQETIGAVGGWNGAYAVDFYDGNVYVVGEQWGPTTDDFAGETNHGDSDGFVAKLNATTGVVEWVRVFGGSDYDVFHDIDVTAHGVFIGGTSWSTDGDVDFNTFFNDVALVVKYDHSGVLQAAAGYTPHSKHDLSGHAVRTVDTTTAGEMVFGAQNGYWINVGDGNGVDINNRSYDYNNANGISTWGAWTATTAVVKFGVDTTAPVIEATPTMIVPLDYNYPLYFNVSDDFVRSTRMHVGYTGTLDLSTAGTYNINLTAKDFSDNEGTTAQTVVVFDELNGQVIDGKTVTHVMPSIVLMVNDTYTCGMSGVDVQIDGETLDSMCWEPDMTALGDQEVYYTYWNNTYEIQTSRWVEVIDSIINVNDMDEVYNAQEVRVPVGYTVTVDSVQVEDGYVITEVGEHVVVINDGSTDTTINFEILELANGVTDGGFYVNETTVTFDAASYTAMLNGEAFISGTTINVWGHYVIEFTEIANPSNVITFNFLVGDAIFKDLFEHGVLLDTDYAASGAISLYGSTATSDGGYIAVGEKDGELYMIKYDEFGAVDFEETWGTTGDDVLIDVTEIEPGRYAALADIWWIDGDFTGLGLGEYQNGEGDWYTYRVLLDVHWDGTSVTMDAFNGTNINTGVVAGDYSYIRTARIEYDPIDEVIYIMGVLDQWSFPSISEAYSSHDLYLAQYTVDIDSFDFSWFRVFGSGGDGLEGWDRIGRMDGYGAPLAVIPGVGVVTGYATKQQTGTVVAESDKIVAGSTWFAGEGWEAETAVVIMVNSDGTTNWIRTIAGNDAVFYLDAEVDSMGNIYIGGVHHSNIDTSQWPAEGDFGDNIDNASVDLVNYTGYRDFFVAKLDSSGNLLWIEAAGTRGNDEMKDIEVDSEGNVIFVGYVDESGDPGHDSPFGSRQDNTRTVIGKITAEGRLIGLETYDSEYLSMFNSAVVLADDEIVAFGVVQLMSDMMQEDIDFELIPAVDGLSGFFGLISRLEFIVDSNVPTVNNVPVMVVEEGLGSLDLLNDYADSVFEHIVFDFEDMEDSDYLLSYEISGTVDFDTPGEYTIDFVAYDLRMNPSVATQLTIHVVAEDANEDGTLSLGGIDYVVSGMGNANLDLDADNSSFVYDAGTVTINGETLDKHVYDVNDSPYDITIPGLYDIVEVFANNDYYVVLDRNIELLGGLVGVEDGVVYDSPISVNFAGTATLNGEAYSAGTEINEAGNHTIVLIEVPGADPITVTFTITSGINLTDEETYNRTKTPVFRGTATLNGESFTSGTDISIPGEYELVITGLNGYTETITFNLTSGSSVMDQDEFNDETILTFRGTATLNGEAFVSGTTISEPGIYELVISGVDTYTETITFTITSGLNGVEDGAELETGDDVTIRFNIGTATISVNGEDATAFTSGTKVEEDGLYVIVVSGNGNYEETYTFRIGEEPLECPDGQVVQDGECVEAPTTDDGLSGGTIAAIVIGSTAGLGGLFFILKKFILKF
jgi:hypothetical protein